MFMDYAQNYTMKLTRSYNDIRNYLIMSQIFKKF